MEKKLKPDLQQRLNLALATLEHLSQRVIADAAERKQLELEIQKQNGFIQSLHETTMGLINRQNVNDVLEAILKHAAQLAETPDGYIYLLQPERNAMEMKIGIGMYESSRIQNLHKGMGFGGEVWRTARPLTLDDYAAWPGRLPDKKWDDTRAIIGVPLKANDKVVGVIVLTTSDPSRRFSRNEVRQLGKFAELASVALENTRLYEALENELQERNRAEAELYLSTERWRALIECAKDYIYIKDAELIYKDVNPALTNLFNLSLKDIVGKNDYNLFDEDTAKYSEHIDRRVLGGKNVEEEETRVFGDGKRHVLHKIKVPLRQKDGQIIGLCGIARDVTEQRRTEEEMLVTKEALTQANRFASLGAMTAGISHEINQPLNSIKITASGILYLQEKGELHGLPEIVEDVREISQQADRIGEIIGHMRMFVHARNNAQKNAQLQPCNIINAIEIALKLVNNQLNAHEIFLTKDFRATELWVLSTMTGLEEIILNILTNSIEALNAVESNTKEIVIAAYKKKKSVILEICDNGPGISEEIIPKVFDPFFTTKTSEQNMGLGLSIIDFLVRSFNGKLEVHAREPGGIRFHIEFPSHCRG